MMGFLHQNNRGGGENNVRVIISNYIKAWVKKSHNEILLDNTTCVKKKWIVFL